MRWVKPEVMCSLIYVTTYSKPKKDWYEWWTKMTANLNVFKTSKKIAFYPNRIFSQKLIRWYIESDKKINILMTWALKGKIHVKMKVAGINLTKVKKKKKIIGRSIKESWIPNQDSPPKCLGIKRTLETWTCITDFSLKY